MIFRGPRLKPSLVSDIIQAISRTLTDNHVIIIVLDAFTLVA